MGAIAGAIVAAVAAAGAGVYAANEQQEAAKYQKKAQRSQTAIEIEKNRRAAVQAVREARIRSAAIQQAALNTGAQGSGEAGAMGSTASMAGSAVGFQNQQSSAALNTSNFLAQSARATSRAMTGKTLQEIFSNASSSFAGQI